MKVMWRHHVQHNVEMIAVKFIQHLLGIGKCLRVEREGTVPRIPTRGAESRPKIDQPITGQLLLSKRLGDPHDFFTVRQRTMRLQVAERPEWWKVREPAQLCIAVQYLIWRIAENKINIARRRCHWRTHHSRFPGEIEGAEWQTYKDAPSLGTDQPRDRHPGSGGAQLRRALTIAHRVPGASPVPNQPLSKSK